jgi:polar amino acid transport system substrate-binding protein
MKKLSKLFVMMLVIVTSIGAAIGLSACNDDKAQVKVIDIKLTDENYAFCVNKSDATLLGQVNSFLTQIKSDGTFDNIVNKYFGDGTPTGVTPVAEGTANALVVATNAAFEPFEYLDGATYYGIDMEIAQAFANFLNKPLVIKNINFDSIFSEIEAGTADIGMAGITINAGREEMVQFSNTYYNASQMIVVKSDNTMFDECKTVSDVETILNSLDASTKVGYQNGTTGNFYMVGDEDWGFSGYNTTNSGYASAALAITDMINGNLNFVVVDEAPAKKIVEKMNALA